MHQTGPEDWSGALCLVKLEESLGFMHSAWSFCSNSVFISSSPKSRNSFSRFLKAERRLSSSPQWVAPNPALDAFWNQGIHWYIKRIKMVFFYPPTKNFISVVWWLVCHTAKACDFYILQIQLWWFKKRKLFSALFVLASSALQHNFTVIFSSAVSVITQFSQFFLSLQRTVKDLGFFFFVRSIHYHVSIFFFALIYCKYSFKATNNLLQVQFYCLKK